MSVGRESAVLAHRSPPSTSSLQRPSSVTLTVPFFDVLSPGKRTCGILEVVNRPDDEGYGKHADELTGFATGCVVPSDAPDVVLLPAPSLRVVSDEELYEKHAEELTRFATGLVGPTDASDIVSSAVLSCMSSKQWSKVTNARAYLFRGVLVAAHQLHRSNSRRQLREQRFATRELFEPPELRPEILAAVNALSVRQRAVTVLTYWFDLDPSSIARLLDVSEGSVRRHLARARSRLKESLDVSA